MKPIVLVGMMGAGKSTVGKRLATRLRLQFVDSDQELEMRCGTSVATIFDLEGEAGFRRRETEVLVDILQRQSIVLGTGGGAVIAAENRELIGKHSTVIYLRAQLADLWHRTRRDKRRPLLQAPDPKARLSQLLESRIAFYESVAHYTVDTGRQPVDLVVNLIINRLGLDALDQGGL
jgi:shikimate kinase